MNKDEKLELIVTRLNSAVPNGFECPICHQRDFRVVKGFFQLEPQFVRLSENLCVIRSYDVRQCRFFPAVKASLRMGVCNDFLVCLPFVIVILYIFLLIPFFVCHLFSLLLFA